MSIAQERGISSLKELIEFVILSFEATLNIDSNKDRKISISEILSLVTQVGFKMPGIYDQLQDIKAEWKDLTDEEVQALVDYFATRFQLPKNQKLEEVVRITARMLVSNYQYYRDMRAILMPVD